MKKHKHKCGACRWDWGFSLCSVYRVHNPFTDEDNGIRDRAENYVGTCSLYEPKWYRTKVFICVLLVALLVVIIWKVL